MFHPRHENHAITEVAFAVSHERVISDSELRDIVDAHDCWRDELPKMEKIIGSSLSVGPATQLKPIENQLKGVSFGAVKRDGSIDWMVRFVDQLITVNCGSYTRWANVWPTARKYLLRAKESLRARDNNIVAIGLQYVDEFVWKGKLEDYNLDGLFKEGSEYFPQSLRDKGPLWHLHQGWFVKSDADIHLPGRRLEKIHLDAVEINDQFVTRVDTTLRQDLQDPIESVEQAFGLTGEGLIDKIFDRLHLRNKQLIRAYLTPEMAARIKLDAGDA